MIDLFEKCEKRMLADDIRERGLYPYFHALESRQDVEVMMEGKRRIMLGVPIYAGKSILDWEILAKIFSRRFLLVRDGVRYVHINCKT